MALKFNTPLLVYGENVSYEYGGSVYEETYSARNQLSNGVASDISIEELVQIEGITEEVLEMTKAPSIEELQKIRPNVFIIFYGMGQLF